MDDGCLESILIPPPLRRRCSSSAPPPLCSAAQTSADDLRLRLASASMELATMRDLEKAQEDRLWRLQALLDAIRKERDDAREECRKLQERLLLLLLPPPSAATPPLPDSAASPPPWGGGLPDQNLLLPPSDEGSADLDALFLSCSRSTADPFDMLDLSFLQPPAIEGGVGGNDYGGGGDSLPPCPEEVTGTASGPSPSSTSRSLSRQSSSNSTAASASPIAITPAAAPPHINSYVSAPDAAFFIAAIASAEQGGGLSSSSSSNSSSFGAAGAMVSSAAQSGGSSSSMVMEAAPKRQRRLVHLPEPPEADPQVVLSSLPEKGKLLQAVMQAGPLLQTLLLAGPLPRWRHPPPTLPTADIPKVTFPLPPPPLLHHFRSNDDNADLPHTC